MRCPGVGDPTPEALHGTGTCGAGRYRGPLELSCGWWLVWAPMNSDYSGRIGLVAAALVSVGAVLAGLLSYVLTVQGVPSWPRTLILPDPIGWAFVADLRPLRVLAMLLAVAVLVALTWLFVSLVVRAAHPQRAAAVFFGTWGAVTIAALVAGIVRAPFVVSYLQIAVDSSELYTAHFHQISTTGAAWALSWGWVTALVTTLIHGAVGRRQRPDLGTATPATTGAYGAPPAMGSYGAYPPALQPPSQ